MVTVSQGLTLTFAGASHDLTARERPKGKQHRGDITDGERQFLTPYLVLICEERPSSRTACERRADGLSEAKPTVRWAAFYQEARRWPQSGDVVLLPPCWVVERSFGWLGRFGRRGRDYQRLRVTLAGRDWPALLGRLLATIGQELYGTSGARNRTKSV